MNKEKEKNMKMGIVPCDSIDDPLFLLMEAVEEGQPVCLYWVEGADLVWTSEQVDKEGLEKAYKQVMQEALQDESLETNEEIYGRVLQLLGKELG